MRNILKEIFSIQDYGVTHRIMYIFGIKLKFPKAEFAKKKKESPYYYYKKNNVDITTLPPATGQLREIQLANLEIMKVFDEFCRENNMEYWLFAGSALGAVRHKGYIPWDDDVDVAMPREDFERFVELFNKKTPDSNLYAKIHTDPNKQQAFIIKVCHKVLSFLFLDIFAVDFTGKTLTKDEQFRQTKKVIETRHLVMARNENQRIEDLEEIRRNLINVKNKFADATKPLRPSDILIGVEWSHTEKNWFIKYESVYPLKEVEFEGCKFLSMQKPEDYLTDYYGDYMQYPKNITMGHSINIELSDGEKKALRELIKVRD